MNNHKTIKTHIKLQNFDYDCLRGIIKPGSHISKMDHPIEEVNIFKQHLLCKNKLKDFGNAYITKSQIETGKNMALNLYYGSRKESADTQYTITVDPTTAEKIRPEFEIRNFYYSTDSIAVNLAKDSLKLNNLKKITIDSSFIKEQSDSEFRADELFAATILQKCSILSNNFRHGNASLNEADIVDLNNKSQYEVTFCNTYELSGNAKNDHFEDPVFYVAQLVDSNVIHITESVVKKFKKKKYADEYEKNLIIWSCGNQYTVKTEIESLLNKIKINIDSLLPFKSIYFITYDFLSEEIILVAISATNPQITKIHYPRESFGLIRFEDADYQCLRDESKYFVECIDIFDKRKSVFVGSKAEVEVFFNSYRVWIT